MALDRRLNQQAKFGVGPNAAAKNYQLRIQQDSHVGNRIAQ